MYNDFDLEIRDNKRTTTGGDDLSPENRKRRYTESGRERARDRFFGDSTPTSGLGSGSSSGFAPRRTVDDYSDDEDDDDRRNRRRRKHSESGSGAAPGSRFSGCKDNFSLVLLLLMSLLAKMKNNMILF